MFTTCFLRVQTDDEGWDVYDLLSDTNMPLSDQNTCMMDRLCEPQLKDLGLKTTLQEIFNLEAKNVIKLHLALVQDSDSDQTSKECVSLEQSLGILLLKGQQSPSSGPDLGQAVLDPPDFSLVPQTIFSNEFQLLVEAGFLERSPWSGVSLRVHLGYSPVNHVCYRDLSLVEVNQANISL